ncbi:MAG: hypothetical protein JXB17_13935 [Bacteroidales bacterium]|nr:hypothetical protein [Bacteroidales bacterium]
MYKLFSIIIIITFIINSLNAQKTIETLNGKWLFIINTNDVGSIRSIVDMKTKDNTFYACSRKKASSDVFGFWTSFMIKVLTNEFKNGSLLRIENGIFDNSGDTCQISGRFIWPIEHYYIKGSLYRDTTHAVLIDANNTIKGTIVACRLNQQHPIAEYISVIEEVIDSVRINIYNPAIIDKKEWNRFENKIKQVSKKAQDDMEIIFAHYYYADMLSFSHFALIGNIDISTSISYNTVSNELELDELDTITAYLKIKSFKGSSEEVDSIMDIIIHKDYKNLIVDLRDNPGGSIEAGMAFASRVFDTSFYGGVFLTQKWFAKNSNPPSIDKYDSFPHFSAANYDLLLKGIHNNDGLCLKVIPKPETFSGKLFLLVNSKTASTCEPIVYGLKQNNRAIIVGSKTAGNMLSTEHFSISTDFTAIIPTAVYYTSDGYQIEQKGISPDIVINPEEALNYVLKHLMK